MVIEVNGLPDDYPNNEMIDKLTMHFLRPSNNGGEVLIVIYPTSNKGQAYVVFESEGMILCIDVLFLYVYLSLTSYSMTNIYFSFFKFNILVPRVLDHNHVLELDGQFYPLDVKKIHQPKVIHFIGEPYSSIILFWIWIFIFWGTPET